MGVPPAGAATGADFPLMLALISPEAERADELRVLEALFTAGLQRYHVRKPRLSAAELEAWLRAVPRDWRARLVLHQHEALADKFGLGGRHWRDEPGVTVPTRPPLAAGRRGPLFSRSCHELATLRAALGYFDAVFYGPVFPSVSKPGYAPRPGCVGEALGALLHTRSPQERRTSVIALGGITASNVARALTLGFDGVAALGAVWNAPDPVAAFKVLRNALSAARVDLQQARTRRAERASVEY